MTFMLAVVFVEAKNVLRAVQFEVARSKASKPNQFRSQGVLVLKRRQEAGRMHSKVPFERMRSPTAKFVLRWAAILFCLVIWGAVMAFFIW
ncbi:hypothetical protein AJ87_21805 [Rhizobium yanglingense]|nr:hypothetical protein AJ87_21805 [Rhizobium yanglingense]